VAVSAAQTELYRSPVPYGNVLVMLVPWRLIRIDVENASRRRADGRQSTAHDRRKTARNWD
jgi:hypothetical protein